MFLGAADAAVPEEEGAGEQLAKNQQLSNSVSLIAIPKITCGTNLPVGSGETL